MKSAFKALIFQALVAVVLSCKCNIVTEEYSIKPCKSAEDNAINIICAPPVIKDCASVSINCNVTSDLKQVTSAKVKVSGACGELPISYIERNICETMQDASKQHEKVFLEYVLPMNCSQLKAQAIQTTMPIPEKARESIKKMDGKKLKLTVNVDKINGDRKISACFDVRALVEC